MSIADRAKNAVLEKVMSTIDMGAVMKTMQDFVATANQIAADVAASKAALARIEEKQDAILALLETRTPPVLRLLESN